MRQKSQLDENVFKTALAPFNEEDEEKESTFEKPEDGSFTDSGLDTGSKSDESCIEIERSSIESVPTFDNLRETVFKTHAICSNVSQLLKNV